MKWNTSHQNNMEMPTACQECQLKVTPDSKRLHEFRRDSRAMAWEWAREDDDPDEEALRRITEPSVRRLYGSWRPPDAAP